MEKRIQFLQKKIDAEVTARRPKSHQTFTTRLEAEDKLQPTGGDGQGEGQSGRQALGAYGHQAEKSVGSRADSGAAGGGARR
jgi:hypothetical protein